MILCQKFSLRFPNEEPLRYSGHIQPLIYKEFTMKQLNNKICSLQNLKKSQPKAENNYLTVTSRRLSFKICN